MIEKPSFGFCNGASSLATDTDGLAAAIIRVMQSKIVLESESLSKTIMSLIIEDR